MTSKYSSEDIAVITYNVVPQSRLMFKYERLGEMAVENRRQYCKSHGYNFIDTVEIPNDRPACWAKIPAILKAFETHQWVLWADSDTLIFDPSRRLEEFLVSDHHLIVQSLDEFFEFIGIAREAGLTRMPINTGVFFIQATDWSRRFLKQAYNQTQFVVNEEVWSGMGEQEAMIEILRTNPADLDRVGYVKSLQNNPKFYKPGDMFVHFYGHNARHHISLTVCEEVLKRWEEANATGAPFPEDLARFHWCCIQNKTTEMPVVHGDLDRYLYSPADIGFDYD
ncbi:galactosyl transferase GMA12/MNN10 family protein [Roseibium album]|nr:galactosyl transferase GMA12/MNN10 family protein [Roseibium album]